MRKSNEARDLDRKVWPDGQSEVMATHGAAGGTPKTRLLTVDQLAKKLQVPKSWIYERTRHSAIPVRKLGKYLRFDEADIDDWVKSNCSLKFKMNAKCGS